MSTSRLPWALIYLTGVFLSSVSQIILKKEAGKPHRSFLAEYLNPAVILSYGIFFGCTFFMFICLDAFALELKRLGNTLGFIDALVDEETQFGRCPPTQLLGKNGSNATFGLAKCFLHLIIRIA